MNVPVAIASDLDTNHRYGSSDGLLGLRELVKFGAVLDFGHRLIFVNPRGGSKAVSQAVKLILISQGYTPVDLTLSKSHLRAAGVVNGLPCSFIVDSGAFLTAIDRETAAKARIGGRRTQMVARGLGRSGGEISAATFPSLQVGSFEIRNASVAVVGFSSEALERGTAAAAGGVLGAEYLSRHGVVFDFNSATLYLRPKKK